MSKLDKFLIETWDDYKNGNKDAVLDSYAYFIEQRIFIKLHQTGEISELEKSFLIDYMKSGCMSDTEILDYEDLKRENPYVGLPEVDF